MAMALVVIVMVFSVCSVVEYAATKHGPFVALFTRLENQFILPAYSFNDTVYRNEPTVTSIQTTREQVFSYIADNPGVHLRGIGEDLALANGVVQYHLWILIKDGVIVDLKRGRYRRFFEARKYMELEKELLSLMKQKTPRGILSTLSGVQCLAHKDLASALGLTSQGLTWQMNRIKGTGIVNVVAGKNNTSYSLAADVAPFVRTFLRPGPLKCGAIPS
jgi:hypothetical protein